MTGGFGSEATRSREGTTSKVRACRGGLVDQRVDGGRDRWAQEVPCPAPARTLTAVQAGRRFPAQDRRSRVRGGKLAQRRQLIPDGDHNGVGVEGTASRQDFV
jgi:hypothetical protein